MRATATARQRSKSARFVPEERGVEEWLGAKQKQDAEGAGCKELIHEPQNEKKTDRQKAAA